MDTYSLMIDLCPYSSNANRWSYLHENALHVIINWPPLYNHWVSIQSVVTRN